jgi:hypothetical protein
MTNRGTTRQIMGVKMTLEKAELTVLVQLKPLSGDL